MKRRNLIAISCLTASLMASPVVFASPAVTLSSVHAMFGRGKSTRVKTVRLTLTNDSSVDKNLLAGEKALTVAAGTSVTLDLPVGTRITDAHQPGSLILEVSSHFDGTTIKLK
ncbi:MAG TPA: hypothetical protein VFE01_00240 [Terracidiphilus sp.]|jgi:hypothetical protein|nr:hypothetical protein [Terracidiphilus sp.]